jgi:hypothetical protein
MSYIFEQPWLLLTAAALSLAVTITIRQAFLEKSRPWHFSIPVLLVIAAFGLDFFIRTDLEKINLLIKTGMRAVENDRPDLIDRIISPDYFDSYHSSKDMLMEHCRNILNRLKIEKNKKLDMKIETSPPTAAINLEVLTKFDEGKLPKEFPARFVKTKLKLNLEKVRGKKWLIKRLEPLEINNHRARWKDVSSWSY